MEKKIEEFHQEISNCLQYSESNSFHDAMNNNATSYYIQDLHPKHTYVCIHMYLLGPGVYHNNLVMSTKCFSKINVIWHMHTNIFVPPHEELIFTANLKLNNLDSQPGGYIGWKERGLEIE